MAIKFPEQPKSLNDINGDWLYAWAAANHQEKWLVEEVKANSAKNTNGSYRPNIFIIRKHFAEKFMPEIIVKKKATKLSFYDMVMALDK